METLKFLFGFDRQVNQKNYLLWGLILFALKYLVEAPHLDGFFVSKKGEFRLKKTRPGVVRLEGTTWYQINIFPIPYWSSYAEWIVHKIHLRVLNHIKSEAEG
jgi:hypothetical protein